MKKTALTLILISACFALTSEVNKQVEEIGNAVLDKLDQAKKDIIDGYNDISEKITENAKSQDSADKKNLDKDGWDLNLLDTARNVDYLSDLEKDIILEQNKARYDPAKYSELYIKKRADNFIGNNYVSFKQLPVKTVEGPAAVTECYIQMQKMKSLPPLKPEKGLYLAALEHVYTQGATKETGHTGVNGESPFDRIKKHGTYKQAAENISYGFSNAREIVISLLIDDNVPDRSHRKIIMNENYNQTAASFGSHKEYKNMAVILYCNGFKENQNH